MKVDLFNTQNKYNIIYADPPWRYNDRGIPHSADHHYNTMDIQDIKNLPVANLADENCVLLMWAVFPMLQEALDTIKAWGFEYKTCAFTWVKWNKKSFTWFYGTGNYTRSNAEICLIATKGELKRQSMGVCSVIDHPIMEHSKKPDIVRKKIVELYGDIPRIELFARKQYKGWDSFGDEL